jgi:hypothetical protein
MMNDALDDCCHLYHISTSWVDQSGPVMQFGMNEPEIEKVQSLAHREGRTRSLQIRVVMRPCTRHKSLTLYPIELGGQLRTNRIRITRPCKHRRRQFV